MEAGLLTVTVSNRTAVVIVIINYRVREAGVEAGVAVRVVRVILVGV